MPIFSVSSIAKRFLVPGWRLGWLIVHDRRNAVSDELRRALVSLTQRTLGPCSILQGALPQILGSTPASMFEHTNSIVEVHCFYFSSSVPYPRPSHVLNHRKCQLKLQSSQKLLPFLLCFISHFLVSLCQYKQMQGNSA